MSSLISSLRNLANNRKLSIPLGFLLIIADTLGSLYIIKHVDYTEIDWTTYMQQAQLVANGEYDYSKITGDTGPLVYPGLHAWIYRFLYSITDNGTNIRLAQYIFCGLYILTQWLIVVIYFNAGAPPFIYPLLFLSKRIHSIYLLRLFNDGWMTLFALYGVLSLQYRNMVAAVAFFSLALGVKMSALLYVPALVVLSWKQRGLQETLPFVLPAFLIQFIVAMPFLQEGPGFWYEYLTRAFDFSRVFEYKWTVNWKFLSPETFVSEPFAYALLSVHLGLLALFTQKWFSYTLNKRNALRAVSESMITGVLCARSLHYQFYAWFYWTVPYLLWDSGINAILVFVLWGAQEYAWNVYPSTAQSSKIVVGVLATVLAVSYLRKPDPKIPKPSKEPLAEKSTK